MKKHLIKGLVATAVGVACLGQTAFAKDLTVWAWDPNFNVAIMKEAAEKYEAKHPDVNVKVVDFAKADIEQKLHTMLASGVTSALPDVVLIEDYNAQKYLQSYPGSFAPMTDAIDYSQFAPYKVSVMTLNDEVYGLPFDTGVTGLYYRTDIIEKAGFTAKDLENITWERFIEIGQQVKEKTGIAMLGNNPSDLGLLRVMIQGAGSWYFNQDGSLNIKDNQALIEGIKIFRDFHVKDIARPTIGWSEWVGAVNSGAVASITSGVWITASVQAGEGQEGKWAVAPTPRLDIEGAVNSSNLGGSSWYVLNASQEKAAAIDFLNATFGTDKEFYNQILKQQGAVGSYLPAGNTEAYQHEDGYFNGQKIYADFNKWAAEIPSVNYGMFTYEVDAAIAAQMPSIMQGAPVEKVLESVEQQLKYQIQ
ncbi:ABC transporter substrate-binding protein [Vibrio sp. 10N.286.49.C2]|uniref:ABC transporter substrate-binding protein n=1 Tax=unclassified Vibrio TaxID=2614977 RepID=UPI000C845109|nr:MULTISPECIES: extracellular solute-binding protein [unclassified Vibrio]PMH29605.1 ABC transporter substrate-binding protein [Vibrio sp. 10N.286.49.C2]PMH56121.1 ABC transporter substrate-binding protein [Vibrio sp. 10N.286.49.B1]PMH81053.1 ABC transporter substrate-binding protein [Vibrio sp. 10N.286.48.B7]